MTCAFVGYISDINYFYDQLLTTELTCFMVLILLHGNIHPVSITLVGSIRYQAHPDFVYV